jgi:hypothetical protein
VPFLLKRRQAGSDLFDAGAHSVRALLLSLNQVDLNPFA